jgi:hypothetical protein
VSKSFLDYHTVGLDLGVDYTSSSYLDSATSYFVVPIHPFYEFRKDIYYVRGGFTVAPGDTATGVLFFPDLYAHVSLLDGKFIPFFNAGGQRVNYLGRDLARMNPWVSEAAPKVISKHIELQGGIKGGLADRWAYAVRVAYRYHSLMPIFTAYEGAITTFNLEYASDVQEVNPHAEIGYRFSDKLALTLQGDYFKYTLDFGNPAYGYPDWKVTFGGHYNLSDKIIVKADLFAFPKTEQPVRVVGVQGERIETVKGWVDGNLEAIYNYKKHFGAFVSLNNLASSRYARWYRYDGYGFNLKAGVILKF